MAVRLPRVDWAIGQVEKECRWLPTLAPLLPLAVPIPLGKGTPAEGYPWSWSFCRWLEGENATLERLADPREAAMALAGFIAALQRIEPVDDATWARGRGWALSVALIALPYYRGTNPDIVARAERTIEEVLAD